jgi:arylformamidase
MSGTSDPLRILDHVLSFDDDIADYRVASEGTRQRLESRLDVSYGSHPDERLDLFFPRDAADVRAWPIHLFVHGGYWRAFSKSDYSFVADTVTELGAIAAIVGYSLMPEVRMPVLIEQVRRAVGWLRDNAASFGGDPGRLSASGHSAGAHLASYLFLEGPGEMRPLDQGLKSVLLISGLYDLAAVRASFLQAELALTPGDVAAWSPIHASSVDRAAIWVAVGEDETPPFLKQSAAFTHMLLQRGCNVTHSVITAEHHMSIIRALGQPGHPCANLLALVIKSASHGLSS